MKTVTLDSRKYYRVVLESIDPQEETPESFVVKLTLRLRMTTPRAKQIVRHMPCIVRSHLSATQANKLKAVLEDMGARCRLESHFVTPQGSDSNVVGQVARAREAEVEMREGEEVATGAEKEPFACPSCGFEENPTATFCSMCQRKFRDPDTPRTGLGSRIPHDNPLAGLEFRTPDESWGAVRRCWRAYKWLIIGGLGLLVLLILVLK